MEHKKNFSYMGLCLFLVIVVVNALQIGITLLATLLSPGLLESSWFSMALVFITMHVCGLSLYYILMKPKEPLPIKEKSKLSVGAFIKIFIICMGATYLFNFVSIGINLLIGLLKHSPVGNPLDAVLANQNLPLQIFVVAISAPIIEEIIFRKLLLDRLRPYGDKSAIWVSALAFSLFHGNLSQALYALVLGMIFAYIVIRTNDIRYSIALHILVNLFGSAIMPLLANSSNIAFVLIAGLLVWVFLIAGIILAILNAKRVVLEEGEFQLKGFERFKTYYLNIGMILYFISCIIMFILVIFM